MPQLLARRPSRSVLGHGRQGRPPLAYPAPVRPCRGRPDRRARRRARRHQAADRGPAVPGLRRRAADPRRGARSRCSPRWSSSPSPGCGTSTTADRAATPLGTPRGSAGTQPIGIGSNRYPRRVDCEEAPMRTLITNGTVVTADGSTAADVLVDGETIAQIGTGLAASGVTADETIDAAGQVRHPGRDRRPHPHGAAVRRHVRQGHVRDRHARGGVRRDDHDRRLRGPVEGQVACARASTRGTPRPRATRSSTTAST